MPEDVRHRITSNEKIKAAVAKALGAPETSITPETALGKQEGGEGQYSWFSPNLDTRLIIGFSHRFANVNGKTIDRLAGIELTAKTLHDDIQPVDVPGCEKAYYIKSMGQLEVFGNAAQDYTFGLSLTQRPPGTSVEEGGFTGPNPNALAATTEIAKLVVQEYFVK